MRLMARYASTRSCIVTESILQHCALLFLNLSGMSSLLYTAERITDLGALLGARSQCQHLVLGDDAGLSIRNIHLARFIRNRVHPSESTADIRSNERQHKP